MALALAAWRAIQPTSTPPRASAAIRHRYARAIISQRENLAAADAAGVGWRRCLLGEALRLVDEDSRFGFVTALPRSALFGQIVIRTAIPGAADEEALRAGRLVNVFITCLDGICDETPELLPVTLPYLEELVAAMPGPLPDPPDCRHPVVALTLDAAATVARLLAAGAAADPALTELASRTTRAAYRRQIETLHERATAASAGHRTALSVATFAVTLLLGAVLRGLPASQARILLAAADPVGDFFGWIDDLVDVEQDVRRGRPNLAALLAGAPGHDSSTLRRVTEQTAQRWVAVVQLPALLAKQGIDVSESLENDLREAAFAWLGFPTQVTVLDSG